MAFFARFSPFALKRPVFHFVSFTPITSGFGNAIHEV